jgi:transcription-repair coupling factor (superfamily II helicase)
VASPGTRAPPSRRELHAPLADVAGIDAEARDDLDGTLERRRLEAEEALDPIGDPLALPDDRPVVAIGEIVARAHSGERRLDVLGARGAALGLLASRLALAGDRPVVVVTADEGRARTLVADLEFFCRAPRPLATTKTGARGREPGDAGETTPGEEVAPEDAEDVGIGEVLLLTSSEASPYAEVSPDRRAALGRLATLAHLSRGPAHGRASFRALVVTASALVRKVVPRAVIEARTERVVAEEELDRDRLVARLAEAGYLRVPVVEDPGSFAVRGALLDVWPPSSPMPSRIELYGDVVLSIKRFDPDRQRTTPSSGSGGAAGAAGGGGAVKELTELRLPPAREAILEPAAVERARRRVADLCDAVDLPTSKARALSEDVAQGRAFFGADGFLPSYFAELDPLERYLPDDALFLLDDPVAVAQAVRDELERAQRDFEAHAAAPRFAPAVHYVDEAAVATRLARATVIAAHRIAIEAGAPDADEPALRPLERTPEGAPTLAAKDNQDLAIAVKQARATRGRRGALDPLVRRIRAWRERDVRVVLTARASTQAERLVALLRGHDVPIRAHLGNEGLGAALLDDPALGRDVVEVVCGTLAHGALLPVERLALVTEEEIFGGRARRRAPRGTGAKDAARAFVDDLRNLAVGDLVVHVEHGIGRYLGLEHRDLLGPAHVDADGKLHQPKTRVDLLVVEYGGGDRLYLPVYRLNQLQKYSGAVGGDGETPGAVKTAANAKLDKLGGSTFAKAKQRVEKAVRQMADELLRLYAERQATEGEPLPVADDEYREFEATFPFEETPDQAKAIADVLEDLQKSRPMERLVCGDVGFGKTEVAIRAAFRAATAGKQVAVLCPTTVLAQQHFHTFEQRLAGYPIVVAAMSRFQDAAQQRETLKRLKEGKVDIVIGTHRLLSKDVHFKELGLLVVDEEQRFGVTHKERIKQLKLKVHALTLTATPIPRTLQMAISGMRDMSLITTPPVDRRAIRTVVTRFDDAVVRDAITRELARGGQVFYVHNRVVGRADSSDGGIYERAAKVQQLVPSARVAVAHGQMGPDALEQAMLDFVEGRFDVLCSTAIIESGLDIPRANTIIVDRADLFGLGQLYQLRGRVGRSKERAYCYLIVPPQAAMSDEARARIDALEKHTELGSGFKIAALDLEIRGAGDLLGAEQSGNVSQVGFELFCQMLDEAVRELRGDADAHFHEVDPELSFDVEAFLPDDYVGDVGVRLGLYKRFAQALDEEQVADLAAEMEDRFGLPPREAACFVRVMRLKCELRSVRALGCEATRERVTLHLRSDTPLDSLKLTALVGKRNAPWKLTPDMRLTRRYEAGVHADGVEAAEKLMSELVQLRKPGS